MMPAPAKQGAPGGAGSQDSEVRQLGEALGGRVEEVLRRTAERVRASNGAPDSTLDPAAVESFERIGMRSTAAVAVWMAGGDPQAGRDTGREAWHTYGQLAAQHAAPLHEVTKRCLCWRDTVIDVLTESAQELGISA